VFAGESPPDNMLGPEELLDSLRTDVQRQLDRLAPRDPARSAELSKLVLAGLTHAIGSPWPEPDSTRPGAIRSVGGDGYVRAGRVVRVKRVGPSDPAHHSGPVKIIVCPTGIRPAAECLAPADPDSRGVLVEPFETHRIVREFPTYKASYLGMHFTTFNRTDVAEQVFDILTVLAAELREARVAPSGLVGLGDLGPVSLLARAMVPPEVALRTRLRTVIDMSGLAADRDEEYVRWLFLPGIRRIGGLRAVAAVVAATGPIWLHHVGGGFDATWVREAASLSGHEARITRERADRKAVAEWLSDRG